MRVLVLTQYFTPEVTAGRFRLEAFAEGLIRRGHEVGVVCALPNHPVGEIDAAYRGRVLARERHGDLRIRRVWLHASPRRHMRTRLANYASFAAAATLAGSLGRRPDIVFASSPPLTVGAAGAMVARRHRVPWVFDVRDLWPESAAALGELGRGRALGAAERLERALYEDAAHVVTVTDSFRAHIEERCETPVEVIPNGTTEDWLAVGDTEVPRGRAGLSPDDFVWTYAGNLGLAHRLEHAIEAAALLGEGFRLVIAGEGARRAELERLARSRPGAAVEFRGLLEPPAVRELLRASDALLVSEQQEGTISAKLLDCMAVRRPVVAAVRGEMERLLGDGAGVLVPPGEPEALAAAIRTLREDPSLRERLSAAARAIADRELRSAHAERLAELLEATADA